MRPPAISRPALVTHSAPPTDPPAHTPPAPCLQTEEEKQAERDAAEQQKQLMEMIRKAQVRGGRGAGRPPRFWLASGRAAKKPRQGQSRC